MVDLNGIFHFRHSPPCADQTTETIKRYIERFDSFRSQLTSIDLAPDSISNNAHSFSQSDLSAFADACAVMRSGTDWYPDYGCALFTKTATEQCGYAYLALVGLDDWSFNMQRQAADPGYWTRSICKNHIEYQFGLLSAQDIPKVFDKIGSLLARAKLITGEKRSAASGGQGHQRTPAFIQALTRQAIAMVVDGDDTKLPPFGATTDVGRHTGGEARGTAWPLTERVLQFLLPSEYLHEKILLAFYLYLLSGFMDELEQESLADLTPNKIDTACTILDAISVKAVDLNERDFDISHIAGRMSQIRSRVNRLSIAYSKDRADTYCIKSSLPKRLEFPALSLPLLEAPSATDNTPEIIRERALRNLAPLPALACEGNQWPFQAIIDWMSLDRLRNAGTDHTTALLVLARIETEMFRCATLIVHTPPRLSAEDINALDQLCVRYRGLVTVWLTQNTESKHLMTTVQRSKELLVIWIAFCLVHKQNTLDIPLMRNYSIPLHYRSLDSLVLDDKRAYDAAIDHVAEYIRRVNHESHALPLFCLSQQAGTFDFAKRYATTSRVIQERLTYEKETAKKRRDEYWQKVLDKKALAKRLESQLPDLKAALHEAKEAEARQLKDWEAITWDTKYYSAYQCAQRLWRRAVEERERAERNVSNKEQEIKDEIKAPPFVVSPLPQIEDEMACVIFFFEMPSALDIMSRLCVESQAMLVPRPLPDTVTRRLDDPLRCSSWASHYNQYQTGERKGIDRHMIAFPSQLVVPRSYGPSTVEYMPGPDEGIWFPSSYEHKMISKTGKNPWHIACEETRVFYTEQIVDKDMALKKFQWAIAHPASSDKNSERGNVPCATQDDIPRNFNKPSFLALGALRSYPYQQFRKLIGDLRDKKLPLGEPLVWTAIRMVIYQVGELEYRPSASKIESVWRTDILKFGGLATIEKVLVKWAEHLHATPRDHSSINILAELASYFSQFSDGCRSVARRFSRIAIAWAKSVRDSMGDLPPEKLAALRAKECLMYGYAIMCQSPFSDMTDEDLIATCELIVLFRHGMVYADNNAYKTDLLRIQVGVQYVMSQHITYLVECVKKKSSLLTAALRRVLERAPTKLIWKWVRVACASTAHPYRSFCFVATSDAGDHYAICLLTGTILWNGSPPGRLPKDVRNSPIYKRCFGDRDFEVMNSSGVLKTVRAVDLHYFYEFTVASEGHVIIREIDARTNEIFELVDFGDSRAAEWFKDLPHRLRDMHSHWINRKQSFMVFRPKLFKDRAVDFLLSFHATHSRCYEIPLSSRSLHTLLKSCSSWSKFLRIGKEQCQVLAALEKFEDASFIHVLVDKESRVIFHLPRFGLRFWTSGSDIRSYEHAAYRLAKTQQLDNCLPFFEQYLILELIEPDASSVPTKMIIPDGEVYESEGRAMIRLPDEGEKQIRYFVYNEHPRTRCFGATSIEARLHLAAVMAASGTMLRDTRLRMTASEAAQQLVRQSWVNRPLTDAEEEKLMAVQEFSYREPALAILCHLLYIESAQLRFLHNPGSKDSILNLRDEATDASLTEFRAMLKDPIPTNQLRRWLDKGELNDALGFPPSIPLQRNARERCHIESLPPSPVSSKWVKQIEERLFPITLSKAKKGHKAFPLKSNAVGTKLERHMMQELKLSWDAHQGTAEIVISALTEANAKKFFHQIAAEVASKRNALEKYLYRCLDEVPPARAHRVQVLKAANRLPTPCFNDLLRISFDRTVLYQLNPYFSRSQCDQYHQILILFLQVCVLEDRLRRIQFCRFNSPEMLQELRITRDWSPDQYPRWLVFEVEGRLQIRSEQFLHARHLLDNPMAISQLNMGLGKTRVILPLLIMHYASQGTHKPRIHILHPLLQEAIDYMHLNLTASVLHIRIEEQPFHRDVVLSSTRIAAMTQFAKRRGNCLILAPEHRLSLELKLRELEFVGNPLAEHLRKFINKEQYVEIFDESDALLSHRYQLIYAVGATKPLDSCEERAAVAQALLRIINSSNEHSPLNNLLQNAAFAVDSVAVAGGRYRKMRLIQKNDDILTLRQRFRLRLTEAVLTDPPPELLWMKLYCAKSIKHRNAVFTAIIDDGQEISLPEPLDDSKQMAHVLALRGYLAHGLLEHALEQRNRVDYGISNTRRKQLAVPFRAADVPSERSEFSHPDLSILLTILAYYQDGLTEGQVREALTTLLRLGGPAQEKHYTTWITPILPELSPEEKLMMDLVTKLDLTNSVQMELLLSKLKYSVETINFWINTKVLRRDTAQYPKRIMASAWHLVNGTNCHGFSGTNDNYRLLPLPVKQSEPEVLSSTNGRMLECLLHYTMDYSTLSEKGWRPLLDFALKRNCDALIDTGSLLAGIFNKDAAYYIVRSELLNARFRAVYYFDPAVQKNGQWMVADRETQQSISREASSIHEKDAFILFDDARSRGADMKMQENAVAVVTLGPKLTKDKLMQGAGRMRRLGKNQKLVLVGHSETDHDIRRVSQISSGIVMTRDILQWVMHNTQKATMYGLPQWAHQGLFFSDTQANPQHALVDEDWSLETLYGSAMSESTVAEIVQSKAGRISVDSLYSNSIKRQCNLYGSDTSLRISNCDEECEREVQIEEEEEEEKEIEIRRRSALLEESWAYEKLLDAKAAGDLSSFVAIHTLDDGVKKFLDPKDVGITVWSQERIFCTENFFRTVDISTSEPHNEYLRPVDAILVFENSDVLLLSDKEGDAILKILWTATNRCTCRFINLTQFRHYMDSNRSSPVDLAVGHSKTAVSERSTALLQLFNGETMFRSEKRKQALYELTECKGDRQTLREIVAWRGNMHLFSCSDLERMCGPERQLWKGQA